MKKVRRAGERGRGVVSVFRDKQQSGRDDGGSGANIERVVAIASGSYYITL